MKDTNNLLTYNQWSSGEYDNTLQIVDGLGQKTALSSNCSSIGETSYLIIRNGDSQIWSEMRVKQSLNSYAISCDIYSPLANGSLYAVTMYTDGTSSLSNVGFVSMYKIQHVNCTGIVTPGKTISYVSLRIVLNHKNVPVYVDNSSIIMN